MKKGYEAHERSERRKYLRKDGETMGKISSSGPGERVRTEKDGAETITLGNITVIGTTNNPA